MSFGYLGLAVSPRREASYWDGLRSWRAILSIMDRKPFALTNETKSAAEKRKSPSIRRHTNARMRYWKLPRECMMPIRFAKWISVRMCMSRYSSFLASLCTFAGQIEIENCGLNVDRGFGFDFPLIKVSRARASGEFHQLTQVIRIWKQLCVTFWTEIVETRSEWMAKRGEREWMDGWSEGNAPPEVYLWHK